MPYSYYSWKQFHDTRRSKRKDYRTALRDVRLRRDGDTLTFHYSNNWERKQKKQDCEVLLATLTPDNVLTFHINFKTREGVFDNITICNRIHELCGVLIGSNRSGHRNKESSIRLYTAEWKTRELIPTEPGGRTYEHYAVPRYSWSDKTQIPYNPGLSFRLHPATGEITELLHAEPDRAYRVKPQIMKDVKADTAVLRKLVMTMARIGSFDGHMERKIEQSGWFSTDTELNDVNYKDPTGKDAEIVFLTGLSMAVLPDRHVWEPALRRYIKISTHERLQKLRARAVENGMKALRKHLYATQDGYELIDL